MVAAERRSQRDHRPDIVGEGARQFPGIDSAGAPADDAHFAPIRPFLDVAQARRQRFLHAGAVPHVVAQTPVVDPITQAAQDITQQLRRERASQESGDHQNWMAVTAGPVGDALGSGEGGEIFEAGAPFQHTQQMSGRGRVDGIGQLI